MQTYSLIRTLIHLEADVPYPNRAPSFDTEPNDMFLLTVHGPTI